MITYAVLVASDRPKQMWLRERQKVLGPKLDLHPDRSELENNGLWLNAPGVGERIGKGSGAFGQSAIGRRLPVVDTRTLQGKRAGSKAMGQNARCAGWERPRPVHLRAFEACLFLCRRGTSSTAPQSTWPSLPTAQLPPSLPGSTGSALLVDFWPLQP